MDQVYAVTHVDIMPRHAEEGARMLAAFAAQVGRAPGLVRFEVLQEPTRVNHFTLVGVWRDQQAFDDHLAADYTRRWREQLQPLLGSPFDERLHRLLS